MIKETSNSRYICQNKLDNACFQQDMTYGDFKDLPTRTTADKAFNIAKNPKHDGCQRGITPMIYKCFDKKSSGNGVKRKIMSNQEVAELL